MTKQYPPHYARHTPQNVVKTMRGGGGVPPTATTTPPPPWQRNYVPASPYAHLLGRAAYPPQRGFAAWIGDRLNIPEVLILRGHVHRHDVYMLLQPHGIRVQRIGYQQAAHCGWLPWRQDTYIRVERYHGLAAEAVLRDASLLE